MSKYDLRTWQSASDDAPPVARNFPAGHGVCGDAPPSQLKYRNTVKNY